VLAKATLGLGSTKCPMVRTVGNQDPYTYD
jgi:hypothetical protein